MHRPDSDAFACCDPAGRTGKINSECRLAMSTPFGALVGALTGTIGCSEETLTCYDEGCHKLTEIAYGVLCFPEELSENSILAWKALESKSGSCFFCRS